MNNNVKKVIYNYKNFGILYGTSFLLTKTIFRKLEHITRKHAIKILDKEFGYIYEEEKKKVVYVTGYTLLHNFVFSSQSMLRL